MDYATIGIGILEGIAAGGLKASSGFLKNSGEETFDLTQYLFSVFRGGVIGGLGAMFGISPDAATNVVSIMGFDYFLMNVAKGISANYKGWMDSANAWIAKVLNKSK